MCIRDGHACVYPNLNFLASAWCRFGGLLSRVLRAVEDDGPAAALESIEEGEELSRDQFSELLGKVDAGLRALPATAQVAKQQGEYMAQVRMAGSWDEQEGGLRLGDPPTPFKCVDV